MLFWVIIGCEVAFWVLLGAGLGARYLLKWRTLSTVLLVSVPLIDVFLLIVSVIDMRNGATASLRHGLAIAYIAYSVMFGHRTIRWADQRFARRFAGGPPPWKPAKQGRARVRYELVMMGKILIAWAIAWGVAGLMILLVGDGERTAPLVNFTAGLSRVVLICAIVAGFEIYSAVKKGEPKEVQDADDRAVSAASTSQPRS